jgi:hypothetical protein
MSVAVATDHGSVTILGELSKEVPCSARFHAGADGIAHEHGFTCADGDSLTRKQD